MSPMCGYIDLDEKYVAIPDKKYSDLIDHGFETDGYSMLKIDSLGTGCGDVAISLCPGGDASFDSAFDGIRKGYAGLLLDDAKWKEFVALVNAIDIQRRT